MTVSITGRAVSGDFDTDLLTFIKGAEGPGATPYVDTRGIPTIGYGYALVIKVNGTWEINPNLTSDFSGIYTFTEADNALLTTIAGDLNDTSVSQATRISNATAVFDGKASGVLSFTITDDQAEDLFFDALDRNVNLYIPEDIQTALAGTDELIALESLAYNGGAVINPGSAIVAALEEPNPIQSRFDVWYQILFNSNRAGTSDRYGIENRRFDEADEFGLYSGGDAPANDAEALQVVTDLNANYSTMNSYLNAIYDEDVPTTLDSFYTPAESDVLQLGYYAPLSTDIGSTELDTANNIVSNNSIVTVDGAELYRLNEALSVGFSAGNLIYVPTGGLSSYYGTGIGANVSELSGLSSSDALPYARYVYDSDIDDNEIGTDEVFAIGAPAASPVGVYNGALGVGSLTILDDDGDAVATFIAGQWGGLADSDDGTTINVTVTNSVGTYIGMDSINKATGAQTYTPVGSDPTSTPLSGPTVFAPPSPTSSGGGGPTGGGLGTGGDPNSGGPYIFQIGGQSYYVDPTTGALYPVSGGPFPDGGPTSNGTGANAASGGYGTASTDPIVLDLSGTGAGVQLVPLADSSAYFDLDDSGFAVNTGWVGSTTGILVNTTDPTNITDLFGNSSETGFAALQALDIDDTGVLNSSDPGWSDLYVWVDSDGVGTGEVESLADLGITSISLNTSPENELVNGNYIGDVATFTYSDDSTGQVAEAYFDNSEMDSEYEGSYTLDPETLLLPDLRGYLR
jgi:GH24 family phage-related lysozyme (muramidase)